MLLYNKYVLMIRIFKKIKLKIMKTKIIWLVFAAALFVAQNNVLAEEKLSDEQIRADMEAKMKNQYGDLVKLNTDQQGQATKIASTDVYNVQILENNGTEVTVSFDVYNKEGIQSQIKYAAKLFKETENSSQLVDFKVYDELLSVGNEEQIHREIRYELPNYLNGKFKLYIELQNSEGMLLSLSPAGDVDLKPANGYISIDESSCYLFIGEDSQNKYNLVQGVDVASSEKLTLNCDIENKAGAEKTLTPNISSYYRNIFGEKRSSADLDNIILESGKKVEKQFVIPKPEAPQAYDAVLSLVGEDGKIASNKIIVHYVVQGPSGTIQNIIFDKDKYRKGEVSKINFAYFDSADSFTGSRAGTANIKEAVAFIKIADGFGKSCGKMVEKNIEKSNGLISADYSMEKDCNYPQAEITVKDPEGRVLAQTIFKMKTDNLEPESEVSKLSETVASKKLLLIVLIILLAISLAIVFTVRSRKAKIASLALFLAGNMFLLGAGKASADSYTLSMHYYVYGYSCPASIECHKAPINLSSSLASDHINFGSYPSCTQVVLHESNETMSGSFTVPPTVAPGATLPVTVGLTNPKCSNTAPLQVTVAGYVPNGFGNFDKEVTFFGTSWAQRAEDGLVIAGGTSVSKTINAIAPNTPGDYIVRFYVFGAPNPNSIFNIYKTCAAHPRLSGAISPTSTIIDVKYKVVAPTPVNGVCGASNGGSFATAPSSGLCNTTATTPTVSGSGPWTWKCTGSGGGTDASCSASKLAASCTGSVPTNAGAYDAEESSGLAVSTSWAYSATDTATKCQYRCTAGSWMGSYCGYNCGGSIPTDGVSYGATETSSIFSPTPWSYSGSNTVAKCQFYCKAGTSWDGSGCVNGSCAYSGHSCNYSNSVDCADSANCGQTNNQTAFCVALNSCTGTTENLPAASCVAAGKPCSDQTATCPACSGGSGDNTYREVLP